ASAEARLKTAMEQAADAERRMASTSAATETDAQKRAVLETELQTERQRAAVLQAAHAELETRWDAERAAVISLRRDLEGAESRRHAAIEAERVATARALEAAAQAASKSSPENETGGPAID